MYTNRILSSGRLLKISLIEDDPQMREMLKDFFKEKFPMSETSSYSTGEDALKNINDEPDLIVLDYNLDSIDKLAMNGLQVLKKLKDRFPAVPVIFLSGQENAEIAENIIKFGAWDYLMKNENAFHRLEIHINNILGQVELQKNLGTQKFFNRLLAFLVLALLVGIIIIRMGR